MRFVISLTISTTCFAVLLVLQLRERLEREFETPPKTPTVMIMRPSASDASPEDQPPAEENLGPPNLADLTEETSPQEPTPAEQEPDPKPQEPPLPEPEMFASFSARPTQPRDVAEQPEPESAPLASTYEPRQPVVPEPPDPKPKIEDIAPPTEPEPDDIDATATEPDPVDESLTEKPENEPETDDTDLPATEPDPAEDSVTEEPVKNPEPHDKIDPTATDATDDPTATDAADGPAADLPTGAGSPDRQPAVDFVDRSARYALPNMPQDLRRLPDLEIHTTQAPDDWHRVDQAFGIVTVAYTIDSREPAVYLVWDRHGHIRRAENLDRRGYSNRCRHRSDVEHFRRRLMTAKRRMGILRPMRIIGLVPAEVDRGFAAAQLDAVKRANLKPDQVASTVGRYDITGTAPYGIIIENLKPIRR